MYSLLESNATLSRDDAIADFTGACKDALDLGWACGSETSMSFNGPFPRNATVDLVIELSDWASGKELEFVLGDSSVTGQFDKGTSGLYVKFSNSTPAATLTVRLKAPDSGESIRSLRFVRPICGQSQITH